MSRHGIAVLLTALLLFAVGCSRSTTPIGGKKSASQEKPSASAVPGDATPESLNAPKGWEPAAEDANGWVGYPDVPHVPVMTEVDGIEIPRTTFRPDDIVVGGEGVDVGNPAAEGKSTAPVTGGTLTIRVEAEPNSLNPITDTSAYGMFFNTYTQSKNGLTWQNWETFELEPYIAKSWVIEDSVKLRPDLKGHERRVALDGQEPEGSLTVDVKSKDEETSIPVKLRTFDGAGKALGNVWVGFKPVDGGEIVHAWSDEAGSLEAAPKAGKYEVLVGDELYGELKPDGDGYSLTSLTDKDAEPVMFAKDDVIDVQRQTIFTYYLRDDVTWSDGKPFTSKDLEFGFAVINNPNVDGDSIRLYYEDVVECRGLEPHVVRLKYRKQYFLAQTYTSDLAIYVPPWHLFEKLAKDEGKTLVIDPPSENEKESDAIWSVHGQPFGKFFNEADSYNRKPLGVGPYVVTEWSQQDKRMVLERRKDFWSKEHAGYLDKIIVKFIEDYPTALQALRAGEIDVLWRPTAEQFFKELAGPPDWVKKNYVKAKCVIPTFSYVGWNMRRPYFQDRRVRLALAMLFDKTEFFEKNYYGAGVTVSGPQYFFGKAYDHSVKSVGYDPSAARDLLAEAGWIDTNGDGLLDKDGKAFRFTLLAVPGNPTVRAMIEVMQRNYRQAGIDVDVREMEWASYLDKVKAHDFDVITMAWLSDPESDPFQIWHGSQAPLRGSNHVGFQNEEANKLIETIRITLDPEERRRLFYSFHRLIDSEQPYDFLWTRQDFLVYNQKFRGVKMYALRPGFDLREWYIPKELQ